MTVRTADRPKAHVPESKSFTVAHFKTLKDSDAPGTFEAIVAVFDNIDSYGDRIRAGAFTRTLDERGLPPIVWSHDWLTPPIGATLDAEERTEAAGGLPAGLYLKARLLVDQAGGEDHAVARQVWAAMTAAAGDGRPPLKEFSFGFRTRKAQWVEEDPETLPPDAQWTGGEIRDLLDLDLYEAGPTLVGANSATELIAAKATLIEARRHGLTSDDVRNLLDTTTNRKNGDDPPPQTGAMPDDVKALVAAADARRPPNAL